MITTQSIATNNQIELQASTLVSSNQTCLPLTPTLQTVPLLAHTKLLLLRPAQTIRQGVLHLASYLVIKLPLQTIQTSQVTLQRTMNWFGCQV